MVSVIIPTFNGSKTIKQAICSVLEQTCEDYEIIVVDDGSTDSTVDIVKTFQQRVNIIQQTNQGTMTARQNGVNIAKGDFIAFLDQDDLWFPSKLEMQVEILKKHPEIELLLANMKCIDENGKLMRFNVVPPWKCYTPSWRDLLLLHPICFSSALFRTNTIVKIGGLDCRFGFSGALGDSDTVTRVSEVAKLHFMNKCVGCYCWSELRPGRLYSFLENFQIYAMKYWNGFPLSDENNVSLRTEFIQACNGFVLDVYRLLLKQYGGRATQELLLKLNDHHHIMMTIFGDLYQPTTRLHSIDRDVVISANESLRTLLFLYLLRSDLQSRFPEVVNGDLVRFLTWAFEVSDGWSTDSDYRIVRPLVSKLEPLVDTDECCLADEKNQPDALTAQIGLAQKRLAAEGVRRDVVGLRRKCVRMLKSLLGLPCRGLLRIVVRVTEYSFRSAWFRQVVESSLAALFRYDHVRPIASWLLGRFSNVKRRLYVFLGMV